MKCKRCLQIRPGVSTHSIAVTVHDEDCLSDGIVVGSVDVNLCSSCANEMADLLLDFVRDNTAKGDLRSGTRVEY